MRKTVYASMFSLVFICASAWAQEGDAADPRAINPSPGFDLFLQSVKVVLALGLTLVLLVLAVWLLKKIMQVRRFPGAGAGPVRILAYHYIAPKKAIALVRIVDRVLVLGVADQSITTLGELSPEEIQRIDSEDTGDDGVFSSILSGLTRRHPG